MNARRRSNNVRGRLSRTQIEAHANGRERERERERKKRRKKKKRRHFAKRSGQGPSFAPSSERNSGRQKPREREIKQPRNPINRSVDIVGNKNSPLTDYLIKNGTASLAQPSFPPPALSPLPSPFTVTLKCKPNWDSTRTRVILQAELTVLFNPS